jgi:hypothetical protein
MKAYDNLAFNKYDQSYLFQRIEERTPVIDINMKARKLRSELTSYA